MYKMTVGLALRQRHKALVRHKLRLIRCSLAPYSEFHPHTLLFAIHIHALTHREACGGRPPCRLVVFTPDYSARCFLMLEEQEEEAEVRTQKGVFHTQMKLS